MSVPVGVGVVVHEPGAVVVHIHGPRLVILPQHHVFHGVDPGHAKGRVRVVVVAIDGHLPVVGTLWCQKQRESESVTAGTPVGNLLHQRCARTFENAAVPSTTRSS